VIVPASKRTVLRRMLDNARFESCYILYVISDAPESFNAWRSFYNKKPFCYATTSLYIFSVSSVKDCISI